MEKLNDNTQYATKEIREILTDLENKNTVIMENEKKASPKPLRAAGIVQPLLNSSEISWRNNLRGTRHLYRY